jgi:CMP/dCMP kinase
LSPRKLVIAIDGPAASGKSTTARLVAERMGYLHLDTGAMYRAIAAKVLRLGHDPSDHAAVLGMLPTTHVELQREDGGLRVYLDGEDVTSLIRTPAVTRAVSPVSSIPGVRAAMVREQRRLGAGGGVVLEGRDIGTVVFPDADLKIFLVAGIEARASRRMKDLTEGGTAPRHADVLRDLAERDRLDSTREASPLRKAPDAVELDTSGMTIGEQVDAVVELAEMILKEKAGR